jgi:O-antigen ligase
MDRRVFAQALAASALILLALYVIDQYGYTDLKGLLLLAALALVAVLVSAPGVVAAAAITLALYLLVIHQAGDRLLAVAAVGLVALVAAVAIERQGLWRF